MFAKLFSSPRNSEKSVHKSNNERTFVIIKGDAIARGLMGEIISTFEKQQFSIVAMKLVTFTQSQVEQLYGGAKHLDFYPALIKYMMTGPHLAMVLEGENALQRMLALKGKIAKSDTGDTLRNKYAIDDLISTIHCSHNARDFYREVELVFDKKEIHQKNPDIAEYVAISHARHTKIGNAQS